MPPLTPPQADGVLKRHNQEKVMIGMATMEKKLIRPMVTLIQTYG